ncbi:hypothetical protein CGRA01v4_00657 [Colletotrichum graminicola]|nr:hypothetical protein CGRA01v4_00657 [Colletotrichum graminicola]
MSLQSILPFPPLSVASSIWIRRTFFSAERYPCTFGLEPIDRGQPHTHTPGQMAGPGRNPCASDVRSPREWSSQSPINYCQNKTPTQRGAKKKKKKKKRKKKVLGGVVGRQRPSTGGGLVCARSCACPTIIYHTLVGRLPALPFLPACFANNLSLIGRRGH